MAFQALVEALPAWRHARQCYGTMGFSIYPAKYLMLKRTAQSTTVITASLVAQCAYAQGEQDVLPWVLNNFALVFWLGLGLFLAVMMLLLVFRYTHFYIRVKKSDLENEFSKKIPFSSKTANYMVVFPNITVAFGRTAHCVHLIIDGHLIFGQDTSQSSRMVVKTRMALKDGKTLILTQPRFVKIDNKKFTEKNKNDILLSCQMLLKQTPIRNITNVLPDVKIDRLYLRGVKPQRNNLILRMRYVVEEF